MIAITTEPNTDRIVFAPRGDLNDEEVTRLLSALEMTDDDAPVVIDLSEAGELSPTRGIALMSALAFRFGQVVFRGAHPCHRRLVAVAS